MKTWTNRAALVICLLVMTFNVFADIPPQNNNSYKTNETIVDRESDAANRFNLTPLQTVIIGLLLSISLGLGGFWLLRARSIKKKSLQIVAVIVTLSCYYSNFLCFNLV